MGKWFGIRQIKVEGREVMVSPTLQHLLERKARRCLVEHRVVQVEVCRLISGEE